eukprot:CAMPEP_0206229934 /NCGR_PEP_ID=MMETSP0047_2-20121206/9970_1 /ASSEMBLY_ACC=CAM_ASM_000192 /TAXON_ID=195065 /ORGANISM="Chroomonas mesostigmatica_cf, Strain CCMP1168" /LENGTH=187 /DNA_ID=CAMNT_0053653283 /DNA_START=130 /DNA_END=691 /DNA_ORIENTATION=+
MMLEVLQWHTATPVQELSYLSHTPKRVVCNEIDLKPVAVESTAPSLTDGSLVSSLPTIFHLSSGMATFSRSSTGAEWWLSPMHTILDCSWPAEFLFGLIGMTTSAACTRASVLLTVLSSTASISMHVRVRSGRERRAAPSGSLETAAACPALGRKAGVAVNASAAGSRQHRAAAATTTARIFGAQYD